MMQDLGFESSNVGLGKLYQNICDTLIIDDIDVGEINEIEALGISAIPMPIIMNSEDAKVSLAEKILKVLDGAA